jgi:hypothetical protein
MTMNEEEDRKKKDGFGLDKDRRQVERRERRDKEDGTEPLDPAFPYRVISFDSSMLFR